MESYDIFISYRRVGGDSTARILCERLREAGYKVFMDVEDIRSGDFNVKLYDVISNCKDFLIVLSQNALDRCSEEGDWVRNELSHALKEGKNVIPVLLRGFAFPQTLPEDIDAVRRQSGLEASTEFFDAFIEKLYTFLKSKPTLKTRIKHSRVIKKAIPFFIALVVMCGILIGAYAVYRSYLNREFPYTQEEKNIVGELLSDVGGSVSGYNIISSLEREALQYASNSVFSTEAVIKQNALSSIDRAIYQIQQIDPAKTALSAILDEKLNNTPINKAAVLDLMDTYSLYQQQAVESLRFIKFVIDNSVFSSDIKKQIIDLYLEMNTAYARMIVYQTNAITLPIHEDSLTNLKTALSYCTSLPYEGYIWITDEEALNNQLNSVLNKLETLYDSLATLTGNQNVSYAYDVEAFSTELKEMGYTDQQIDEYIAQIIRESENEVALKKNIQLFKEKLYSAKEELESGYNRLRSKYAPLDTDEAGILWSKMLIFLSVKMYEESLECLTMFAEKQLINDPNAEIYVPAIESFINSIDETGIDYGAIVLLFENGSDNHPTLKLGDIIVAVNGERCLNADHITNGCLTEGAKITILRFIEQKPVLIDTVYRPADFRVGYYNLTQREYADSNEPYKDMNANELWEKMREFAADVKLDSAIDCLQMYHMLVRESEPNADIYVPALWTVYGQVKNTGINFGTIVTDIGEDSSADGLYVGDVIIAVNQSYSLDIDSFNMLISDKSNDITILRAASGTVEELTLTVNDTSHIKLMNIG